jgi:hypothetical protein
MTYVHDKKKQGNKVNLDKGFGITKEDKKRAVAVDYTIDTNKRMVKDKVNKAEPRMSE